MGQQATDETLIADFAGGRRAALGELAQRYEASLLGLSKGLLSGDSALAQDAVQETWVRVIRFAGQFNGRSSFKTWLYRIAINQCRNLVAASPNKRAAGHVSITDPGIMPSVVNPVDAPESRVASDEKRSRLHQALDALGCDQRDVVLLCYHAGMTHSVAAEILHIPIGTLKSRLSAALAELRRLLAEETKV